MSLAYSGSGERPELSRVASLDIQCEDCGRTKRMWPGAIQEVIGQGTRTLMGLHNRLSCSVCRERGGLGKNINLVPTFRRSA